MNYKLLNLTVSVLAALIISPLFAGIIVKTKALFAGRKGQSFFQIYFNLFKLFKKQVVYSKTTTVIFKIAPAIIFVLTLSSTIFIPVIPVDIEPLFSGDMILMIYLLGLARLFLILSSLDTGSSFEGMGASREAFYSALIEPVIFIVLISIMKFFSTTSIAQALFHNTSPDSVLLIFAGIPLFIVILVENSRIPFDDPETHLELTMIHEVMILDNSGPSLGLMEYASYIKLWFFSLILTSLLVPTMPDYGIAVQLAVSAAVIAFIAVLIGIVESVFARVSLIKIPQFIITAGVIALMGFFFSATRVLVW
ncbi:MAG: NADH-quinone oxidoreductase subunit H [Deltaproteobacteria bacterium]|nr:NADH-quinone oxidoreductase subunit H [Deltaproteobacteria bacterium]